MIIEDYCSFETALLLKEKGFDAEIKTYWWKGLHDEPIFEFIPDVQNHDISNSAGYMCFNGNNIVLENEPCCIAPTLQIAMKWLREVHNIHISITIGCDVDNSNYVFYWPGIAKFDKASVSYIDPFREEEYNSYEEAAEQVIKYCLENLVN